MPVGPETIGDETQLEDLLSEPSAAAVAALRAVPGDLLLLGVAGKMGPTLARMARRAADQAGGPARRIVGVARFSQAGQEERLRAHGVETLRGDLLDEAFLRSLPDLPNVIFLAGMKFGATGQEALTWAMNTWLPAQVARRFAGSRLVALSTGNVYGLVPAAGAGSRETDLPAPVGEYAMSCLGRERMFEHFSRVHGTRGAIIRLNYAGELRYGVLADLARKVWAGEPVDLAMGWFNTLWQADANAHVLAALAAVTAPPAVFNVTGPEKLRVRDVATEFGRLLGRPVVFTGAEQPTALLNDARATLERFGGPRVDVPTLMRWIADWVRRGGPSLNKPTHFESRDGKF